MLITRYCKASFLKEFREFNQWTERMENNQKEKQAMNSKVKPIAGDKFIGYKNPQPLTTFQLKTKHQVAKLP